MAEAPSGSRLRDVAHGGPLRRLPKPSERRSSKVDPSSNSKTPGVTRNGGVTTLESPPFYARGPLTNCHIYESPPETAYYASQRRAMLKGWQRRDLHLRKEVPPAPPQKKRNYLLEGGPLVVQASPLDEKSPERETFFLPVWKR
ncbi:uncharacterized protein AAES06_017266 isoform 2-T2 [Glossophaga mutica]